MWKYRITYLAVILSAAAVYIATNQRQIFMLLITLLALPVLSCILLLLSTGKVHIMCELQDACVIHQRIGVNIRNSYHGFLPIGRIQLLAEYENRLFESKEGQMIVLESGKKAELSYQLPYVSEDCGRMEMHFQKVAVSDLMGLFTRKIPMAEAFEFTIYPELAEMQVSMTKLPNAKNLGDHYDQNRKGQDVTEVFSIREYQEGDSQRSIHWKLSSKWNQLVVREFSHPSNYETLVLYDPSYGTDQKKYHEVVNGVLGAAASISKSLMQQNHMHHIGCLSKSEFYENRVEDNSTFMQALVNMMSTPLASEKENILDEFIKRDIGNDFTKIVLVTASFDEWNIRRLSDIASVTVVLISKEHIDNIEETANYSVITRSVDSLGSKAWILEI